MSRTILVVDDSGLARRGTRRILEGAGYTILEAEDGMAALERYFVDKPDLVLLDLVMKGMYGIDVLTKLRALDAAAQTVSFAPAWTSGPWTPRTGRPWMCCSVRQPKCMGPGCSRS